MSWTPAYKGRHVPPALAASSGSPWDLPASFTSASALQMPTSPDAGRAPRLEVRAIEDVHFAAHGFEAAPADAMMQCWFEYGLLGQHRPEIASLARFAHSVNVATFYLCAAFERGSVRFDPDFRPPRKQQRTAGWFGVLIDDTFHRFRLLRHALMIEWTPSAEVEPLTYTAFSSLCELAPAAKFSLRTLFLSRRTHAVQSLVGQLDLVAKQIEDAVRLADDAGAQIARTSEAEDAARLAGAQDEILSGAGEPLSLSEAAKRLGTSRQNLHKRIVTGSALGVMRGRELVVPTIQFVDGATLRIVQHLRPVTALFREAKAGDWSLLQFLSQHDPVLNGVPIEGLKEDRMDAVLAAARAFLGLDER